MAVNSASRLSRAEPASATLKNGNLFLHNVSIEPQNPPPGSFLDVSFTVSNGAWIIGGDPDCCGPGCGIPGGSALNGWNYKVQAVLWDPDEDLPDFPFLSESIDAVIDSAETDVSCLGTTEVGTKDDHHTLELTGPTEPGTYPLDLQLKLPGSDQTAVTTRDVTFEQSSGDGGNGGGNGSDGSGDYPFGLSQRQVVLGTAGLAVVGGAYLAGQDGGRRR